MSVADGLTEGRRIYAIGDIHGCRAELAAVHALIRADLAAHPHPDPVVVHLGDYVDRGPDSRGVLEDLIRWDMPGERVCLLGNHDDLMRKFFEDPWGIWCAAHWLAKGLGGKETLASYGVAGTGSGLGVVHEEALAQVPQAHLAFLATLPRMHRIGGYLFVHAGIMPGVPLEAQNPEDLIWIRDRFLSDRRDHGLIVVHGHTPTKHPDLRRNRIGIDTGACFGGVLTCLVLEDGGRWLLEARGRRRILLP